MGSIILVLVVIIVVLFCNLEISLFDGVKFKSEYEELNGVKNDKGKVYLEVNISSSNIIDYSSVKKIKNLFDEKLDGVIYMGYPSCAYCRSAVQVLCDVSKNTELDKIYYLDVSKLNNKEKDKIVKLLDDKFLTENGDIYAPLVLFVADGVVVSYNKGTLFSQTDPYKKMDDSQKQGLGQIYQNGIRDVLEAMK